MSSADAIAKRLKLQPHPEGGRYREVWRSDATVTTADGRSRPALTTIYYLLEAEEFSAFHRVRSDEVWHLYSGGPVELMLIDPESGKVSKRKLGLDIALGEEPQVVVPAGWWQAAIPASGAAYALCGCTVGPGFDFEDFELADAKGLVRQFPKAKAVIEALTR
jgi:predicted cupin superfamily sugar epimerase